MNLAHMLRVRSLEMLPSDILLVLHHRTDNVEQHTKAADNTVASMKKTLDSKEYIRGSLNKFPDFFRMGTFNDSTHMKLWSPSK